MKAHKWEFLDFAPFDYQYIQRHLREMAAKGWQLERIGTFGVWHYRRADPADVRYEITYAPSASAYNSRPTEAEETLSDLCADAGWEQVATLAQIHIYRSTDPHATPLETDESTRIATLRRAMNRHFVPQNLLVAVLFLVQFIMHLRNAVRWPVTTLSSGLMVGNLILLPTMVLSYLAMIAGYLWWVRRAKEAAENEQRIPECVFYRRFRWFLWALLLGYLGSLLLTTGLWILGVMLILGGTTVFLTSFTLNCCKKAGAPRWVNILVPMMAGFIGLMLVAPPVFGLLENASLNGEQKYVDSLPLTLSDLTDAADTERTILEQSSSPIASYARYWDKQAGTESDMALNYIIIDTEFGFARELCLNYEEQVFLQSSYTLSNGIIAGDLGDLWGAAYARRAPGDYNDRWLICWEDRIVSLRTSWPMTDEQIAIAAELLKPR